jgi:hypothetical protein
MHTPEPRQPRYSGGGGGAESVTPQAERGSVTPTPRAGFLRRGDTAAAASGSLHATLAAGPSVLFDDESGTTVALDVSPQPSQLTQHQHQPPSQLAPGQTTRLPRQRPRFHTVQDLDVALNQAIEGKINSRNAWASKEASDLLEGITHTIETTLDAASADDYAGFAKAATVVEGCSKVWTSRVDSTYQQSNQMVQRLLRKDNATGRTPGEEEEGREGNEEDVDATQPSQRSKSRSRSAAAAAATRTLALDVTEINLDSKSRTALTQTGVNAQFRAITSKFDQGNAQGLLMNNAPIGRAGNIILDVDYSLLPPSVMAAERVSGNRGSGRHGAENSNTAVAAANARGSGRTSGKSEEGGAEVEADAVGLTSAASRASQHAAVEYDAAVNESVVDLPLYTGVPDLSASPPQPASARPSFAASLHHSGNEETRASQASQLDPLLLLPHASSSSPPVTDFEDPPRHSSFPSSLSAEAAPLREVKRAGEGNDDDDDAAGDGNSYDDWSGDGGAEYADDGPQYTTEGSHMMPGDGLGSTRSSATAAAARDVGLAARDLVSGVTEMEAVDTLFHGHTQLALEAEDPTSWCPLSELARNPLAGGLGRSELSRLHREHRFLQSPKQLGLADGGGDIRSGISNADHKGTATTGTFLKSEGPSSPAAKRSRKERTVVFQLPDHTDATTTAAVSGFPSNFSTTTERLEDGALRQATTAARHITPLGKQLLFARDAAHNVAAFTQSAVQRSKAEQAGLVLPEAPIPGKTIPSYLPYPIHTQDYFQPFSTSLTQWNLLRKSATGRLMDSSSSSGSAGNRHTHDTNTTIGTAPHSSGVDAVGGGGNPNGVGHHHRLGNYGVDDGDDDTACYGDAHESDMPVEFFPGGAEVEGVDGGEAGGDYADYADLYGPDGDGGDDDVNSEEEQERRYIQEGFRSSADARLLAQVELAAAAARSTGDGSSSSSGRSSGNTGGAEKGLLLSDPMALLQVLSSQEATIPNQVDVVRLRQLMWEALQGHLAANQQDRAADLAVLRSESTAAATAVTVGEGGQGARRGGGPVTSKPAVKAHAQAVLDRLRHRSRTAEENEEEGKEEGKEREELPSSHKPGESLPLQSSNGGDSTTAAAAVATAQTTSGDVVATKFSDVVRSVLPHIASVSSTNTLSPAFFFFSILFLANEHNVVLQSVDALDDLRVCGIARRVGEA